MPTDWRGTERFAVRGCLGQGGMGVVYEAFDNERRHPVALKTLTQFDPAALYLFKQEFRTLANVTHNNLVHFHELVMTEGDLVFFTMELVRGVDFLRHVTRPGADPAPPAVDPTMATTNRSGKRPRSSAELAPSEPLRPLRRSTPVDLTRLRAALPQLVAGVHALHSAGKLHRDLKPSNVLVNEEGRVVVLDFGVSTELRKPVEEASESAGEVVGTPRYMAPEATDDAPSCAADWYGVGVMLYEALVGRPPFTGSLTDVLAMKNSYDPAPPAACVEGVPPDLDSLCMALLARDPVSRPTGPDILRRLGGRLSSAPPPRVAGASEARLIGREAQVRALREAFEAARGGRPVTVRVGGQSGMGKSTLVHSFLDEVSTGGEALVLRGRAYEREAVPYKAVDSVVDALSRHLMRLDDAGEPVELPGNIGALAQVFPVLRRIPAVRDLGDERTDDPQGLRRRAFAALSDLLATLARHQPVIVFLDDVQWGDLDSVELLLDLLRPPRAPPVLWLMTYRDGEMDSSPFLVEMRKRWPEHAEVRDVTVGPLAVEDALLLALALLETDDRSHRVARAIARESRGSPFLVEELARSNRGAASSTGATLAVLSLDQMVSERLERLSEPARRLIEIVAVGGRPLPVAVAAEAASVEAVNETVALLGARRFVHVGLRGATEIVETIHDRIRETIVGQLRGPALRQRHEHLAQALERAPEHDPEAIATHWLGAGHGERAARFAESAAEQAVAKLAFDRAVGLFRLALEHTPASSPEAQHLRARFAEALRFAGRHQESAREYITAADRASGDQRVELRRAAAEQLLNSGRLDEGMAILHRVLADVGVRAPRSPLAAVFWLLVYRVWLALRGIGFTDRAPEEVSPASRVRIDALFTVSYAFATVDSILAACMQARHLIEALRLGDRFRVLRALTIQAAHVAAIGKPEDAHERALVAAARGLAVRLGTEEGWAFFEGAWGVGCFHRGRWREARELFESRPTALPYGYTGHATKRLFSAYTYFFLGELKENARQVRHLLAEAADHGELFTTVSARTSTMIWTWLAEDDPERARRDVREALAEWSQSRFLVQHFQAMTYGCDIDLYAGEGGRAYEHFVRGMPALKKSFLLYSAMVRTMTAYTHGRLAIASIESAPGSRDARIAEARRASAQLGREYDAWSRALAALVRAAADNAAGDRAAAVAALRSGIAQAEASASLVFAGPARYRLGELLGGEEGKALVEEAARRMTAQGIRNPARWVRYQLPGQWGS